MAKIEIGDTFELITLKGKAYLQYVYKKSSGGCIVRVFGLYSETPENLEKVIKSKELFLIGFAVDAAEKKKLIRKVGNFSSGSFQMPQYMRTDHINFDGVEGWHIVNIDNLQREFVIKLTPEQKMLSPWESWNDTLLKERLENAWTLDKWI